MRHLDWLQAQRPHRQLFSQRLIISKIRRVGGLVMATWIVCHLTSRAQSPIVRATAASTDARPPRAGFKESVAPGRGGFAAENDRRRR
jgi:hypothetical protein